MRKTTGTTTDPWEVVKYEAKMLFELRSALGSEAYKDYPEAVKNACAESACLHTRILVDILLSNGKEDDDIRLKKLLPGFSHSSLDELRKTYGDRKTENSPCWTFNKMIAHATLKRGTSHDYTDTLEKLLPKIEAVLQKIQNDKPGLPTKLPNPSSGVDQTFCAKTSS